MQFGLQWLRDFLGEIPDNDFLHENLPLAGFEIERLESVSEPFTQVVVGKVTTSGKHPNADRLNLCTVTDGQGEYSVVCGAPNVREGIHVAFSRVGAVLPGNMKIKRAKIRGEVSEGMICSERELGISDEHDQIIELPQDAILGTDIYTYLHLDENIIDIDVTPNRGDCLSVRGIAREIASLAQLPFTETTIKPQQEKLSDSREIVLSNPEACPLYCGRIITLGTAISESPGWIRQRLQRAGLRPVNLVVDITNLVMLHLGQPMHAFDNKTLQGAIQVRYAQKKEQLLLLNDQQLALDENHLVIADDSGAIALAGIMGGQSTAIHNATEQIFLEAAHFAPQSVAGKARNMGLHSDAAFRFERGVDWQLPVVAIEMATQLLIKYAQASVAPITSSASKKHLPSYPAVTCSMRKFTALAGVELKKQSVIKNLTKLGIDVQEKDSDTFVAAPPSWRFDITRSIDIFEEVLRQYGLSRIAPQLPQFQSPTDFGSQRTIATDRIRDHLVGMGYQEVISYSFLDTQSQHAFLPEGYTSVELANPISADQAHMRYSLIPSLLKTHAFNARRQYKNARLMETGLSFQKRDNTLEQMPVLALLLAGQMYPDSWSNNNRQAVFYDLKGDIEALFALTGNEHAVTFRAHVAKGYHPGKTAQICLDGAAVGIIGEIHPELLSLFHCQTPPVACEIALRALVGSKEPQYTNISAFPKVYRDMALVVDKHVTWQQIKNHILQAADNTLVEVTPFDVYTDNRIGTNKKSIALRLHWQSVETTLTDEGIDRQFDAIIQLLGIETGAELRS